MAAQLRLLFNLCLLAPSVLLTAFYLAATHFYVSDAVSTSAQNLNQYAATDLELTCDTLNDTVNHAVLLSSAQQVYYGYYGLHYSDRYSSGPYRPPLADFSDMKRDMQSLDLYHSAIVNYVLLDESFSVIDYATSAKLPVLANKGPGFFYEDGLLYYLRRMRALYPTKYPAESDSHGVVNRTLGWMLFQLDPNGPAMRLNTSDSANSIQYFITLDGTVVASSKDCVGKTRDQVEELDSRRYLVFEQASDAPLKLAYSLPKNAASSAYSNLILWSLAIFLFSSLAIYLLSSPLSRRFCAESAALSKNLAQISRTGETASVTAKTSEIAALIVAFNGLMRRIERLTGETKRQAVAMEQLERKKKEAELIAYQAQLNPHFLSNAFANATMMIKVGCTDKAVEFLSAIGRMLRLSLYRNEIIVPLSEELEHLNAYLDIQKLRFRETVKISMEVPEELLPVKTVKLILQPLVENTFLHGIEPKGGGTLIIRIFREGEKLIYRVEDDGVGMEEEAVRSVRSRIAHSDAGSHLGLVNVDQRIRLNFGEGFGLAIDSRKGVGTSVTVTLPYLGT